MAGRPDRNCQAGLPGQDSQDRAARTGQPTKDSQDRTVRDRTARTGLPRKVVTTGSPRQVRPVKTSYQYFFYRPPILYIQNANFVNMPLKNRYLKLTRFPPLILKKRYIRDSTF
jgi:hypothetical protein